MMNMDLKKSYSEKWIELEFDAGPERYKIRHLPESMKARVLQECTTETAGGPEVDWHEHNIRLLNHCLVDWDLYIDKKPAKCNAANKLLFFENLPDRVIVICDKAGRIESFAPDLETIKKNYRALSVSKENGKRTEAEPTADSA